jgi:putative endonuclease
MPYYLYILKSESRKASYVGHTDDLTKRLGEHNCGKSLSTRGKGPWRLAYHEKFDTRSEAALRERYYKSIHGRLELKAKGIL